MISSGNEPETRLKEDKEAPRTGRQALLARRPSRTDNVLYAAGWILFAAGICLTLLHIFAAETAAKLRWPFPCPFYSCLGIPCLGCGATRALRALAAGRLWESLRWHPAAAFFAAEATAFMVSQTLGRLSRGRLRMLTFHDMYIYALVAVILLQWLIKLLTGWTP